MRKYELVALDKSGKLRNIFSDGRTFKHGFRARCNKEHMQEVIESEIQIRVIDEKTDTERLEWLVANHARPVQKPDGKWVCEVIKLNGYASLGDFDSFREAVDAMMEKTK